MVDINRIKIGDKLRFIHASGDKVWSKYINQIVEVVSVNYNTIEIRTADERNRGNWYPSRFAYVNGFIKTEENITIKE